MVIEDLIFALTIGVVLGVLYFSSMWLSVRTFTRTRHPVVWLIASAGVRIALIVAAFYLVMDGQWQRLLACLAGFVLARLVLIRRLRPQPSGGAGAAQP